MNDAPSRKTKSRKILGITCLKSRRFWIGSLDLWSWFLKQMTCSGVWNMHSKLKRRKSTIKIASVPSLLCYNIYIHNTNTYMSTYTTRHSSVRTFSFMFPHLIYANMLILIRKMSFLKRSWLPFEWFRINS